MMRDAILNFSKQFKYRPKIEGGKVKKYKKYIIAGMGGSHLAGDILKTLNPALDIAVWPDYGLPQVDWKKTLLVASSYSGNTEEPVDALETALKQGCPAVAIAVGGKILEIAKARQVPYIQLPDTGIQPRSALGFSLLAMLKVFKQSDLLRDAKALAKSLAPVSFEESGKSLAAKLQGRVPVIYASAPNYSIAYNWKIKFNETGKVPAFYNVFPELNHNEMTGYDVKDSSRELSKFFHFIFLKDGEDHPQVRKRFDVTAKLYCDRGLPVEVLELSGNNRMEKIFFSLLLADWAALHTADNYGLESEAVPMVEEFKRLIK